MKITEYNELAETPNDNDFLIVVDVSDTSMAATGTTKKVKKLNMGGGGLANVVEDITPQLGGNLDVNGNKIVSVSNGSIGIEANGTGVVKINETTGATSSLDVYGDLTLENTYGVTFRPASGNGHAIIRTDNANFANGELLIHSTDGTGTANNTTLNFAKGFSIYSETGLTGLGATYAPYISSDAGKLELSGDTGGVLVKTYAGSNADITLTPDGTGDVIVSSLTASELVATSATKELESLAVATYPSLTELTYVKGVTSAIQTQLGNKQAADAQLDDIAGLTPTDNAVIIGNGTNFVAESGATLKTSLGLTIGTDVLAYVTPGADGNVLTSDGANWVSETLSAGGKTYYNVLVAPTGGDYTTLYSALNNVAVTSGMTIFIRNGTYAETGITSTKTDITIIGESRESVILAYTSQALIGNGINWHIRNVGFTFNNNTNAYVQIGQADSSIDNCKVVSSNAGAKIYSSGTRNQITNNYITDNNDGKYHIQCTGSYALISGNYCYTEFGSGNSAQGTIHCNSVGGNVVGNTVVNGQQGDAPSIYLATASINVTGNTAVSGGYAVFSAGTDNTITGNKSYASKYGIYTTGARNVISGNNVHLSIGAGTIYGISVGASDCSVTGNTIYNVSLFGTGIYLPASIDNCTISANKVINFATGLNISASTCDNNVVTGNNFTGNTALIADSGTATILTSNLPASAVFEKKQSYMKNTSGSTINAGNLVVWKAVAAGDEVTTTTTAGDDKVYGLATAAILNNAYGYIQTLGKTTLLTVNGTTDIAIGDPLTAFTAAGIVAKAGTGDMVFAYALEAYTTDDSLGVIDALIISPRLI